MASTQDYLTILACIDHLPFPVGKTLLIDILRGNEKNESIVKNRLFNTQEYASLAYTDAELKDVLDEIERKGLIAQKSLSGKKFWKVLHLTERGRAILKEPSRMPTGIQCTVPPTTITDEDRTLFTAFGDFLAPYNDKQKKAIIHRAQRTLCIAGAGSGKTTVLTKRIEYLIRYQSILPNDILAITFTRKARAEMIRRLTALNIIGVHVHTFNSFCEQLLREHGHLIYLRDMRVLMYRDRIKLVRHALDKHALSPSRATAIYFTPGQRRSKSHEQLFAIFVNDLFFILDYYKSHGQHVQDFSTNARDQTSAQIIYRLCKHIEQEKTAQGYRDFIDQLVDGLTLIRTHPQIKPRYAHILVDEYQDVNDLQIQLLNELGAPHSFLVGDPRQAIYGWRGSRVQHILDRITDHDVISLTQNYRSLPHIVSLMNEAIAPMKLLPLNSARTGESSIHFVAFPEQHMEFEFVTQKILDLTVPREEIFVLARTNRQLNELSHLFSSRGIAHVVRSDEVMRPAHSAPGELTLATIHAIKGLEADVVFVVGCSSTNFPCKSSDHPVIDLIKIETHDPEEEERRLFYVAISRAKNHLYLTYSTKRRTAYITDAMVHMIGKQAVTDTKLLTRLKQWRKETADIMNVPAYIVLPDAALEQVAAHKPATPEELLTIKGFGPVKVHHYGDAILKIVGK